MKVKVGIIGPGNIGSDLMFKVMRSRNLEMGMMAGIAESEGIRRAASLGFATSVEGVAAVVSCPGVRIAFDATSAAAHVNVNAPALLAAGIRSIDLTPAALGPYCVPSVNLDELRDAPDVNMVTCGGQATIPIINAIARTAGAAYAEIVACISSYSAGPGTRANMDEFTETTSKAIRTVGGADKGKAIIVLNPAQPPLMMTNTITVRVKDPSAGVGAITEAVAETVSRIRAYVPGYTLRLSPMLEGDRLTTIVQVTGQGDFLPAYSGNLDIINAAAVEAAERIADDMILKGGVS